jgi:hypothetical protein
MASRRKRIAKSHVRLAAAADAPSGLIAIANNLAVIDYSRNGKATQVPIQRCPTGAIVWLDEKRGPVKGLEAKKITRRSALPIEQADLPLATNAHQ